VKVLIITYYWPPAGGSGVQRWLKFVKYLPQYNIEPVVYVPDCPHYAILDPSLSKEIPSLTTVIKQRIFEPNNVFSLLGGHAKKTSAGFLESKPSLLGKFMQYVRANYFIPDARKFWVKPSVKVLKNYLNSNSIDAIITTGPPHSLHLIGMQLKREMGIKWIADFRDPWTDIDYFHQLKLSKKARKQHEQLEQEVVGSADSVLVVSNTMKENYLKFNNSVEVITNGYDDDMANDDIKLDKKFSMVHLGLMNADRNPEIFWKVIAQLVHENIEFAKNFELRLIGKVAREVNESIEKYKLNDWVKIINYLPYDKLISIQKSAQVLLLLINNVPSSKGIITGKIFEYLHAKRPILAIGPVKGDLAEIINITNSGKVIDFDDAQTLKNTILEMYSAYKANNLTINSHHIEQYHRRNLTKQLVKILENLNDKNR
jgi:glycosyltransferase involved in cell wall biosynthesis